MHEVEFIYFDLGNVLVWFDHELASQQIAKVANVNVDLVRKIIFDSELQSQYERGEIDSQEFVSLFNKATGSSSQPESLLRAASDIFEINSQIIPLISGLVRAGTPIGILSNTCDAHWSFLRKKHQAFLEMFPVQVLSFEKKCAKPDAEIYRIAAETADVPIERIFFTDDREENVSGANAAGMKASLFRSARKLADELNAIGFRW